MRHHIFCFTIFISIIGLLPINTVDAAEITEYFDSDPGWTSFNLPVDNNDFGFRNSNFAGGNTGEAGGFFSRTDQAAWYGNDSIGNFTGNEILSASGLMNIYNVEPAYNANIHIGHFDSSDPAPLGNGIGFQILEESASSFRIFYKIGATEGFLFIITGTNESRTWSYLYDPDDGSYGSLTVSISGSGGNTAKVFLSEGQRNSIGTLNTFGLAVGREPSSPTPEQLELYIDNVSYTAAGAYFSDFNLSHVLIKFKKLSDSDNYYIKGNFTLGENSNGIDPLEEVVKLKIGTSNLEIPAGSFIKMRSRKYKFIGRIDDVRVYMSLKTLKSNSFRFMAWIRGTDLTDTPNPVPIGLHIGDDMGQTDIWLSGIMTLK